MNRVAKGRNISGKFTWELRPEEFWKYPKFETLGIN